VWCSFNRALITFSLNSLWSWAKGSFFVEAGRMRDEVGRMKDEG
jgi:hypothetical protein